MKKKLLIGITGGAGAGKSAVARIIEQLGYPVLSADEFAREITKPGAPALAEIHSLFGDKAILPNGSLNRTFVREEILRNPSLRKKLEAITHPLIQQLTKVNAAKLFNQGKEIVFYEAPLLFEANSDHNMDKVICVHADDKIRIRRVMDRDKVSEAQAEKLLSTQMPQKEKIKRADFLIANDGTEEELQQVAREILEKLKR